jgi:hypothetical protein
MPSPLSGLNIVSLPADILYNTGTVFAGSVPIGVTKGPPKFTNNRTFNNVEFDGKYAGVLGLDRVINGDPTISFSMLEIGPAATGNQILKFEPGATLATATAPATPGTITPTPSITGGALTAGTYYYKVTALNAGGESLASAEVSSTVASGITGSVALAITAVGTATAYRWYRGTGAGLEDRYYQTATNAYTDIGSAAYSLGAPPAGGSGSTTTYTPKPGGSLLVLADYVVDLRVVWERGYDGSGNYLSVYMPWALCNKYDISGQDKKEAMISVEFVGRINYASQVLTTAAAVIEYRNSKP